MAVEQTDVTVVGGGPGGSTTATLLADAGHKVVLLEREKFPRYQIGESLLPTIHSVCKALGVTEEIAAAGFTVKRGGYFRWGKNDSPWGFSFGQNVTGSGFAYQVERSKFDEILLRNARKHGVDVREESTVIGLVEDEARVVGVRYTSKEGEQHEIRSRYVVDSSGNGSRMANRAGGRRYSDFFQNIAVFAYFKNGKRNPSPYEGSITCAAFREGWFWYIPLSSTLTSVGAVVGREHADKLKSHNRAAVLQELIGQCDIVKDYLSGATRVEEGEYGKVRIRKDWSYTTERFSVPGMILVGDSACFIDPVFSSGVHLATNSALLAVRAVSRCLKGGDETACFEEYERQYRKEYGIFHDFLVRFYDMNQDEASYFWSARRVLRTNEKPDEAFVRLISGLAGS
jgi:halogenation protein CepH